MEVKTIKKLWIALLLTLFLAGCGKAVITDASVDISVSDDFKGCSFMPKVISREIINGIPIEEVEWDKDVPWFEGEFFFTPDENVLEVIRPIETKKNAIEVAEAILEKSQENGKYADSVLFSISYSSETNMWLFLYALSDGSDGGDWVVVVDGNKGSFVKAWAGE